jgi:hypothetical protein
MQKSVQPKMYEYANGHKDWRLGNTFHRTDGPAIEYVNGNKSWYLYATKYTFDNWLAKTTGLTDEEKVMIKLQYG